MDTSLRNTTVPGGTRDTIIQTLWPRTVGQLKAYELDWNAYFAYYSHQCRTLNDVSLKTHQDFLGAALELKTNPNKADLKQALESKAILAHTPVDDDVLENTVILATSLYLMVEVGIPKMSYDGGRALFRWDTSDLKTALHDHYSQPAKLDHLGVRFEPLFKACNFEKVAGIKIDWTSNLIDHLRINEDEETGAISVAIFSHVSFLQQVESDMFPAGLLQETLETIALLLPSIDKETTRWYRKALRAAKSDQFLDRKAAHNGHLSLDKRRIEYFKFYHDRLVMLKQEFDVNHPATMKQWWRDRRNRVQWSTFWVAVLVILLTIFFGLFQSILGVFQVYKAYHPTAT